TRCPAVAISGASFSPKKRKAMTTLDFLSQFVNGRCLELRAIHPSGKNRQNEFFQAPRLDRVSEFLYAFRDHHLYFGVAERGDPSQGGGTDNCTSCAALFCDLDFKLTPEDECRNRLSIFRPQPSILIRSGGGLHA